jgi:hypothetical protein
VLQVLSRCMPTMLGFTLVCVASVVPLHANDARFHAAVCGQLERSEETNWM